MSWLMVEGANGLHFSSVGKNESWVWLFVVSACVNCQLTLEPVVLGVSSGEKSDRSDMSSSHGELVSFKSYLRSFSECV